MYEKRFEEIKARKLEIRAILESGEDADLEKIQEELRNLEEEEKKLRARMQVIESLKDADAPAAGGDKPNPGETRKVDTAGKVEDREAKVKEEAEKRGQALKENRAVTVGSSNIILPQHQATDIRPTFNEVSSLIDRVNVKPLIGGESFKQPYLTGYGTGDYTTEGADYAEAEATFGYADINKAKVTAYAEDTEELQKLPAAAYDAEVMKGISVAARKKISREILVGTGATNRLAGIFSSAATAIDASTDISISAIDETTLDEIVYSFGGDEDVEDTAVLILNKKDLKAFATLRDAEGQKVYDIKSNGNTGTIDSVPFIINSACKAISDAATATGEYCMAYGPLSNYMLTIFSDMEVQRSTDYKFKQGMIAHRGSVFLGGNVVSKNGFLRVKKG
ncbi:phage major capsid protein [Desulfoscipio geothermicus]|uniref:Phage major capsid protein, HK97 family n=1 Tax=Desulfoscipio geothermicus DSM 3669 TaxID=1121426 RepID=A0A1I6ECH3_9FIRM|nr:phage major capsid protein [Desulfoscipio geothermicus]SFR15271.1 phage major capsid protein, HK97 family [Desulfoscipio geothermicus DSM 3669]